MVANAVTVQPCLGQIWIPWYESHSPPPQFNTQIKSCGYVKMRPTNCLNQTHMENCRNPNPTICTELLHLKFPLYPSIVSNLKTFLWLSVLRLVCCVPRCCRRTGQSVASWKSHRTAAQRFSIWSQCAYDYRYASIISCEYSSCVRYDDVHWYMAAYVVGRVVQQLSRR